MQSCADICNARRVKCAAMALRHSRSVPGPALLLVALIGTVAVHGRAQDTQPSSDWTPKHAVEGKREMVAAAHPLAVEAGYRILVQGGSAVDAAVAAQLVLNLVEPQSSGIGGGAFMLVHDSRARRPVVYDGRETAPHAAAADRFLDAQGKPLAFYDAVVGGRSVGVPGVLRMLELAHRRHGRLPWAKLFEPAIEIAERGFPVSPRLHLLIASDSHLSEGLAAAYFHNPDGSALRTGQLLRNPAFAATLRRIAATGANAFYRGDIARDIVRTVAGAASHPGDMTEADLADYAPRVRAAVCGTYRRYRVCGAPPPSSGGIAVLQILGILERFDMKMLGAQSLMSAHLFSEAGRLAYADRSEYVADPDFVAAPSGLTDRAYLYARSALIRIDASMGRAGPGDPAKRRAESGKPTPSEALELPSTSHLSIVDRYGNAVAMTTSIEQAFGSRLMTKSGFLLNNELTDFSFAPVADGKPVANRVEGGKRPRSSMAPTVVYDRMGHVVMVTGSPNGSAIINYVAKNVLGVLDWGLDAQAAIDLPNIGSRNGPTELEKGTAAVRLQPALEALGHEILVSEQNSGVHSIVRVRGRWIGGADPRREGTVMAD